MSDPLLTPDHAESFKSLVHLSLFGLAAMCLGYNAMAWSERRQAHLAVNAVVYGALAVFEATQVTRHLQ